MIDENKLELILTLNSDILKNHKINRSHFFLEKKGGGKNLRIEYNNKTYEFKRNDIDKDIINTLLLNKVIKNNEYLLCPIEDINKSLLISKIKSRCFIWLNIS